ncbi:MAG: hypothetical protein ABH891_04535 [Candidatus Omnitrophota bacterium]
MFEEEGPKDWEVRDEEPPERLQKKWEQEEAKGPRMTVCPSCKKETSAENLTCIFCGTDLNFNDEGCPIRCFFTWVKRLFKKG